MKYMDMCKKTNGTVSTIRNERGGSQTKTLKFIGVIGLVAAVAVAFVFKDKILAAFNPISVVATIAGTNLKETDGRTNVLILGSDRRVAGAESGRPVLTDTILVASIGKVDKDVVLISLPRDLWVKDLNGSHKINSVYAFSKGGEGADNLRAVLQDVLGIPIHYHVMVSFDLFQEIIDILGGVEVTVDTSFTDYAYPIENMEDNKCGRTDEEIKKMGEEGKSELEIYFCRYEKIVFNQGVQSMNGDTALKFVRSRHGTNNENTDFARSRRQQKIITAIKNKSLSIQTLVNPTKLKNLYDAYAQNTDTDIDFGAVNSFYLLSQQINFDRVVSVVLDDRSPADQGGLLYAPGDKTLYNGQYVLIPQTGDYVQIHAFVQRYLFGGK
ncbi:TPA: LytR family transcriptional regulator [candidate division WWE3 bacterium]|uniref:LytR family transcriptional regulator n=1 Tax=candidate division WWE3 bacterium TaxID=2053526 RepID=A0A656PNH3_UNCKA|nr:cell envelope-related transcriptional attenuator [candidate division WWE3 bacterium RAAC2_WWE3_1]KKS29393.1 MAG: Cell envelope-related transcriptional attenuator [candidate division WWE3 bacterium GW2011_GWB1_42_117]KKS54681.1 MAG: Cell envelope-related transcriptional attenuator [candidate division WWE3 bacterium GW2011_GWD2_42_34]KKT05380.1 MAG: Cell envelope-related transcriptional attenuator [candidate division WWE3 bacterium GW2011_GWE2_43_18]KKT06638.1 MAG: Cell envelope-related transc